MSYRVVDRRKPTRWFLRIHPLLLFLALVQVAHCKNPDTGSPKPNDCDPWLDTNQCPRRFLCTPRLRLDGNHCICNRYLGFRGAECRKRSQASWLLLVLSIINAFMSFRALISNIMLALELKNSGRLKANNIGRTLFFNTLTLPPSISIATGYSLILLDVDRNLVFLQHGLQVCLACLFFFYFLSTLSVSMVWIVDVQRRSSLGLGRESRLAKKRQERIWLFATYGVALSCVTLAMIFYAFSASARNISIVLCIYNIIVAGSYHYAGRRVVRDLSLSEDNPTARHVDIAHIAENIRVTSQAMTRLTLGMSVSCIGAALTTPTPAPLYRAQNSLPRILQAQVFIFAVQQCALGVNSLIVEYLRYGSSKRHFKPEFHTFVIVLRWLRCCSRAATHPHLSRAVVMPSVPSAGGTGGRRRVFIKEGAGTDSNHSLNRSYVSSLSDLASYSGGEISLSTDAGTMVWSQLRFNLNGLDARNQRIVKVAAENKNGLIQPQFCSVLLSGAEQFLPMVLITLLHTKISAAASSMSSAAISEQVRGQAVIDIGEGVVVNLDSDDMAPNELGVLSKGSHAFVQCYGEEHLRCTWHAFEFGFAGGHEMLAERCAVLMEGELEVDARGLVTRWLHRGVVDTSPYWELDIPPRWVVKLAGLPFSTAWVPVSALDIKKLEASCQASLISNGILFHIDCGTQQRTPAHTSVLDISGISQTLKVASTSQANIASLKAAITNACVWEDSSMSSTASDTSSDRSESMDLNSLCAAMIRRGVQVCAVPRSCNYAEDMWIVNVSGSGMWKYSPSEEACVSARELLASYWLPKCFTNVCSNQVVQDRIETGSSGGSLGMRSGKGGLDDIADNEGDAETNSSGIRDDSGNEKHTGDGGLLGNLGAISEEQTEGI